MSAPFCSINNHCACQAEAQSRCAKQPKHAAFYARLKDSNMEAVACQDCQTKTLGASTTRRKYHLALLVTESLSSAVPLLLA